MSKLTRLVIKGYKSLENIDITLGNVNILIGPNGAGKSNLVHFFRFLKAHIMKESLSSFMAQEGGADSLLFFGSKETEKILIECFFDKFGYELQFMPAINDVLLAEIKPIKIVGAENAIYSKNELRDNEDSNLLDKTIESNLNEEETNHQIGKRIYNTIENWRVYHFHDTSNTAKVKKPCVLNDNIYLRSDASNLAAFLYRLKNGDNGNSIKNYELIRDTVRLAAPFFDDFILRIDPLSKHEQINLEWKAKDTDFPFRAWHLSDGTLRFMCLATLFLQPDLPSAIIIDEPELGLHPYAIYLLASMIKSAATKTQVIVATQSVTLLNQFQPDDVLVVDHDGRATQIRKLTVEELSEWVGEYSLGELWEKNIFGGRP